MTLVCIVMNIKKYGLYKDYVNILGIAFLSIIKYSNLMILREKLHFYDEKFRWWDSIEEMTWFT